MIIKNILHLILFYLKSFPLRPRRHCNRFILQSFGSEVMYNTKIHRHLFNKALVDILAPTMTAEIHVKARPTFFFFLITTPYAAG